MIKAKVICDSISAVTGDRLTTFEVEFPRFILSEYNTHRVFSRNAASTRAIPILKQLELIESSPAMPVFYGKNKSGMSASEELDEDSKNKCIEIINEMREFCISKVKQLHELGLHKQHAGRYVEPWQTVKGVVSATEWSNWYWLRDDSAAQPEIAELARCMKEALAQSVPQVLQAGQWHLPYVETQKATNGEKIYIIEFPEDAGDPICVSLEDAIKVSCARACAVSFRNTDYGLEKSKEVYERLISDSKIHGSALEHAAKVMQPYTYEWTNPNAVTIKHVNDSQKSSTWEEGISHVDHNGNLWSANFKGFIQHRKTIKGENYV